jgi:hypothetical protein
MKVTAFHMANKVEEAARSYFLNSFVFSSRKIDVERTSDFRNNVASIQFYLHDGEERVPMGGIEFVTIAEQSGKIALQWKSNVLPSEVSKQSFMILSSNQEHYDQYSKLAEVLKSAWEKDMNSYLPKNEEAPPVVQEAPKTVEDEYASLTPEEIEAITGVRPEAKAEEPKPASGGGQEENLSEEDIRKMMGMDESPAPSAKPPAAVSDTTPSEKKEGMSEELSAEEIWRQINGGK